MNGHELNFDDVKRVLEIGSKQAINENAFINISNVSLSEFLKHQKEIHGENIIQHMIEENEKWLRTPMCYSF